MKRTMQLFAWVLIAGLVSCSEPKKPDVIIAHKPVEKAPKQTQKMSVNEQNSEIDWVGSRYKIVVKRQPDVSLAIVEDEDGTKYYDNKVMVRVLRSDGSEFFHRSFVKSDFSKFVDERISKMGALLGVVFVKAEGDNLYFVGSVGSPDESSDEYVPMTVMISKMGSVSIQKTENMDESFDETQ